jgi:hypothetical protein
MMWAVNNSDTYRTIISVMAKYILIDHYHTGSARKGCSLHPYIAYSFRISTKPVNVRFTLE